MTDQPAGDLADEPCRRIDGHYGRAMKRHSRRCLLRFPALRVRISPSDLAGPASAPALAGQPDSARPPSAVRRPSSAVFGATWPDLILIGVLLAAALLFR